MTDADRQRLEEIEGRLTAEGLSAWLTLTDHVRDDLTFLLQLVRDQSQLIHDLQEESAAYQRGAEDMRERAVDLAVNSYRPWQRGDAVIGTRSPTPHEIAETIRALPLTPPAAAAEA